MPLHAPPLPAAGPHRTDDQGAFSIRLPKGGRYVLRALRMGYTPTEMALTLDDTTSMRVEFELTTNNVERTTLLAPVVVRGRKVDLPNRLLEVYERAQRNFGAIFTREDFAVTNEYSHALSTIPGVHINPRGQIILKTCPAEKIQVYINGARFSAPGDLPSDVLKMVAPAEVALLEVYTHVTRIPAEYLNDACAVIAVWTK